MSRDLINRYDSDQEAHRLATAVVDLPLTPAQQPKPCDECRFGACDWSVRRVTLYLHVRRQAHLLREPFDAVLIHRTRSSRAVDPWIRSNVPDSDREDRLRAIGWALDQLEQQHGPAFMHPMNARAVAAALCPERYDEGEV